MEPPITEELQDLFPFPTRILHGSKVLDNLFNGPEFSSGTLPVVMGEQFSVDRLADVYRGHPNWPNVEEPAHIIEKAMAWTSEEFLKQWQEINADYLGPNAHEKLGPGYATSVGGVTLDTPELPRQSDKITQYDGVFPRGPWPKDLKKEPEAEAKIFPHLDMLEDQPFEEVLMGYFPVNLNESWKAAAYLSYSQPPNVVPEIHVALAREWGAKYGARPVTFKFDTLEFVLDTPVLDFEEAIELAKVHYAYCWWSNKWGTVTIEEIVDMIVGAKSWQFTWT